MHNDLGTLVLYELAHFEARRPVPEDFFDDLDSRGWRRMPGGARPSLFPASYVRNATRTLASFTTRRAFNFVGGRGIVDGASVFRIDPASIEVIYGGFGK